MAGLVGYGFGIAEDRTEELRLTILAAQGGVAGAQYLLSLHFSQQGDKEESFRWLEEAAHNGDDSAQLELGKAFYNGEGVEKDLSQAVRWFDRAVDQGNTSAAVWLGEMYQRGDGVDKNELAAYINLVIGHMSSHDVIDGEWLDYVNQAPPEIKAKGDARIEKIRAQVAARQMDRCKHIKESGLQK